jgi:hypothetical protein
VVEIVVQQKGAVTSTVPTGRAPTAVHAVSVPTTTMSTCINHKSSQYCTIQTLIVVNGRLGAKGCPATLPVLHTTELFQSASLSSIICRLLSTMHASPRILQRVHGGQRSGRSWHLIFCLRQATQAVILRLMSGSFRSPKCSRSAFEDWPSMAVTKWSRRA